MNTKPLAHRILDWLRAERGIRELSTCTCEQRLKDVDSIAQIIDSFLSEERSEVFITSDELNNPNSVFMSSCSGGSPWELTPKL